MRVMSNQEFGPSKICVNSIDPGMIETEGLRASGMDRVPSASSISYKGRIGKPDDVDGIGPDCLIHKGACTIG